VGEFLTQTFKEGKVQLTRSLLTQRVIYNLSSVSATHELKLMIGEKALGGFSTHIAQIVLVSTLHGKGYWCLFKETLIDWVRDLFTCTRKVIKCFMIVTT
jgi:hypothetical protein